MMHFKEWNVRQPKLLEVFLDARARFGQQEWTDVWCVFGLNHPRMIGNNHGRCAL